MRERPNTHTIDASPGDLGDRVQTHAARRLKLDRTAPVRPHRHGCAQSCGVHVVQQHVIDQTRGHVEHAVELDQRVHLDLDERGLLASGLRADLGEPRGELVRSQMGDVVVLDEHRVVQTQTVRVPPARAHGILLQHAQARRGLARIQHLTRRAGSLDVLCGERGDAREPAQHVQDCALGGDDLIREARDGGVGAEHDLGGGSAAG